MQVTGEATALVVLSLQKAAVEGAKFVFGILQVGGALFDARFQKTARLNLFGDIEGVNQNAFDFSGNVRHGLIAEGDIDGIGCVFPCQPELRFAGEKWLAGLEYSIQKGDVTLIFDFGKSFQHSFADQLVSMFDANQFDVGGVDEGKAMLRSAEYGHRRRGENERLAQAAALEIGFGA